MNDIPLCFSRLIGTYDLSKLFNVTLRFGFDANIDMYELLIRLGFREFFTDPGYSYKPGCVRRLAKRIIRTSDYRWKINVNPDQKTERGCFVEILKNEKSAAVVRFNTIVANGNTYYGVEINTDEEIGDDTSTISFPPCKIGNIEEILLTQTILNYVIGIPTKKVQFHGKPVKLKYPGNIMLIGAGGIGSNFVKTCRTYNSRDRMYVFDDDIVNEVNLNRSFNIEDIGKYKSIAVTEKNDIGIIPMVMNIFDYNFNSDFMKSISYIVLAVDNKEARIYMDEISQQYNIPLIDGGSSFDGFGGSIRHVVPGTTPTLKEMLKMTYIGDFFENKNVSDYSCSSSLCTTHSLVAELMLSQLLSCGNERKSCIKFSLRDFSAFSVDMDEY